MVGRGAPMCAHKMQQRLFFSCDGRFYNFLSDKMLTNKYTETKNRC